MTCPDCFAGEILVVHGDVNDPSAPTETVACTRCVGTSHVCDSCGAPSVEESCAMCETPVGAYQPAAEVSP